MWTRRDFLKTSAGGLAAAALGPLGCGGDDDGAAAPVAGIYGVGEDYLVFADAGDVFEIQSADHSLVRRRMDGSLVWQIGEHGTDPGELNYPTAIVADHQGQLYVMDHGNSRILVYGADGTYLRQVGGRDADGFDHPMELDFSRAIALDRAERIFVCDSGDHHIHVFERDGTPAGTFGEFGQEADDLNRPIALAIDNQDDVHIVDQGNYRVQVFDNGGQYQRSYGAYGSDVGQFILPRSIVIDSSGRSYVADAAGFRIVVFAPDGRPIDEIAVRFEDRRLGSPLHLAWAPDDRLYVTAVPTTMT